MLAVDEKLIINELGPYYPYCANFMNAVLGKKFIINFTSLPQNVYKYCLY